MAFALKLTISDAFKICCVFKGKFLRRNFCSEVEAFLQKLLSNGKIFCSKFKRLEDCEIKLLGPVEGKLILDCFFASSNKC